MPRHQRWKNQTKESHCYCLWWVLSSETHWHLELSTASIWTDYSSVSLFLLICDSVSFWRIFPCVSSTYLFLHTESLLRVADKCRNNYETSPFAFLILYKNARVFPQFQTVHLFAWGPDMDLWWRYRQDRNRTKSLPNYERSPPLKSSGKRSLKSHLTSLFGFLPFLMSK